MHSPKRRLSRTTRCFQNSTSFHSPDFNSEHRSHHALPPPAPIHSAARTTPKKTLNFYTHSAHAKLALQQSNQHPETATASARVQHVPSAVPYRTQIIPSIALSPSLSSTWLILLSLHLTFITSYSFHAIISFVWLSSIHSNLLHSLFLPYSRLSQTPIFYVAAPPALPFFTHL